MTTSSYAVMGEYLQRHAYNNVWCAPNRDKQVIFKPARLTKDGGVWINVQILWRQHTLPDSVNRFHVYQIGEIHPLLLGLLDQQNVWLNVADTCNSENFIADFYTEQGLQIHRSEVWYRITQEKNLIIAVKIPQFSRFNFDLDAQALYMRLYSNDFYNTAEAIDAGDVVHVKGTYVNTTQDVVDFQNEYATYQQRSVGHTYFFLNGNKVSTINLLNTQIGDYIEYVYDSSIKRVLSFNISELNYFESAIDAVQKYLLHYAGVTNEIDHQDDIDLFLVKNNPTTGRSVGVYYHKNNHIALRMVTHKDYSVVVQYLAAYVSERPELGGDLDNCTLVMHIRHSGYNRSLVDENHRIKDLYRMSDEKVLNALIGVNSTMEMWSAVELEASFYTAIMRAQIGTITTQLVTLAYGYNAISKLVGDTPTLPTTQTGAPAGSYIVPVGVQLGYTAYEYDDEGLLLEWHTDSGSGLYSARNEACAFVEFVFGTGSQELDVQRNQPTGSIDPNYNYRFYTSPMTLGQPTNEWTDVTGSDQYAILNNTLTWFNDPDLTYTLVRSNVNHLVYEHDMTATDGLLRFSINEVRSDLSGHVRNMTLPMGQLDIFLNGRSLIENIDYKVDFPVVTIWNKKYLVNPNTTAQKLVIRFTGFCDHWLTRESPVDTGFIKYGVVSFDGQYEVRSDKVNRIVIDGRVRLITDLTFAEDNFIAQVSSENNGLPYSISDVTVPINSYVNEIGVTIDPTYDLKAAARQIDQAVSDYLTLKIPQPQPDNPSVIPTMYQLVSPFFCKLVYDLTSGALWSTMFTEAYNDNQVKDVLQPYMYLLDSDPLTDGNMPDPQYVVIHPHNLSTFVEMGIYQYKFLTAAVRLFGNGRISLSSFISVAQFGT